MPLPRWIAVSVLAKAQEATAIRSLYPYIGTLAAELSTTATNVALCISLKELSFTMAPLFAPALRAKVGTVRLRLGAGLTVSSCILLIGLLSSFELFAVLVFVLGGAKALADTGSQCLLTEHIPREDVGRATAVNELSWGLSSLVGVPLFGLLMSVGWALPWLVYAGVGVLCFFGLKATLPRDAAPAPAAAEAEAPPADAAAAAAPPADAAGGGGVRGMLGRYGTLLRSPQGRAVAFGVMLLTVCADALFSSFGLWLEEAHGLDLKAVAVAAMAMGVADISAELVLAAVIGRLSPPQCMTAGWALQGAVYLALPSLTAASTGVVASVVAFGVQVFAFEFTIVALMATSSFDSAVSGGREGDLESLQFTCAGIGRIVGAPLGLALLDVGRKVGGDASLLLGVGRMGACCSLAGFSLAAWSLTHRPEESDGAVAVEGGQVGLEKDESVAP